MDPLTDQLGNPVPFLHSEGRLGVVEHDNSCTRDEVRAGVNYKTEQELTDISSVILVHDPGPDVDVVFPGESRAGSNPAVGSAGNFDLDISLDESLASGGNLDVLG